MMKYMISRCPGMTELTITINRMSDCGWEDSKMADIAPSPTEGRGGEALSEEKRGRQAEIKTMGEWRRKEW
jgi:hypothetical protein